jgi:hypothetical protein
VTPIPPRLEIPKVELFLQTELNSAQGARNLAGDERLTPSRGFVVKENSVANKEIVRLAG